MVLAADIFSNFLNERLFDFHQNSESWSLSEFSLDGISSFYRKLLDILMKELIVEFLWLLFGHGIIKLTTLCLNNV
jgi:hypothetical protein